jgi:hypothetical protein
MQKNPCRVDDPLQNPIDRETYEDAVSLEDGIYPITTDDNTIMSSDMVSHGSGSVKDALDNTQTQLSSRANIKRGVNWAGAETIPLSTTIGFYSLKCGKNTGYSDLFIVHDGEWKILGTNNVNITISGDNLIIPIYVRYLLIW